MEEQENIYVKNLNGKEINFDAAWELMDADLLGELYHLWDGLTYQEIFSMYEQAHIERFGEVWELSKSNPVW